MKIIVKAVSTQKIIFNTATHEHELTQEATYEVCDNERDYWLTNDTSAGLEITLVSRYGQKIADHLLANLGDNEEEVEWEE